MRKLTELQEGILELVEGNASGVSTDEICRRLNSSPQVLGDEFEALIVQGRIIGFAGVWLTPTHLTVVENSFCSELESAHTSHPKAIGHEPRFIVRNIGLNWPPKAADRLAQRLNEQGRVILDRYGVRIGKRTIELKPKQQAFVERIVATIDESPEWCLAPIFVARTLAAPLPAIGESIALGVATGALVSLSTELVTTPSKLDQVHATLKQALGNQPFKPADVRQALDASRRTVDQLLAYFHTKGLVVWRDDQRYLSKAK